MTTMRSEGSMFSSMNRSSALRTRAAEAALTWYSSRKNAKRRGGGTAGAARVGFLEEAEWGDRLGRPVLAEFEVCLRQGFDASAAAVGGDDVDKDRGWNVAAGRGRTCSPRLRP